MDRHDKRALIQRCYPLGRHEFNYVNTLCKKNLSEDKNKAFVRRFHSIIKSYLYYGKTKEYIKEDPGHFDRLYKEYSRRK